MEIDENARGRVMLRHPSSPTWSANNLALKIAELADSGRVQNIADVRDDSSTRTGQRLRVVILKRDAVARVVLNNLFKHTELQNNFSANMLALVDGVPRTLTIDPIRQPAGSPTRSGHPAAYALSLAASAKKKPIYRGLVKALDMLDEVIALIRRSPDVDQARTGHESPCSTSTRSRPTQSLRCSYVAWPHRRKKSWTAWPSSKNVAGCAISWPASHVNIKIISDELTEIVDKHGVPRRGQIIPARHDLSMEDLIPDPKTSSCRSPAAAMPSARSLPRYTQKRGGRACVGPACAVTTWSSISIATSNHHWLLFFTNAGRVYRTKAYNLPEASRDAKGGHVSRPAQLPAR
ncbi:MAG: DNA gyrase subunit A [Marmoricola sp.]